MILKRNFGEKLGERLRGIRKTKSGKYGSVIRDPFKKKQVWLGSFDNVEEAANAYLSKRCELEERLKTRQPTVCHESDHRNMIHIKDSGEKSGERLKGVRRTTSGEYGSVVRDPINKKQVCLGSFDNAEEAASAYISKRCEFEEQRKAGQAVQLQPTACQESGIPNLIHGEELGEKSGERSIGVRRRKSGEYRSVIEDPIRKNRIWLASFKTAEEAANAYLNKKRKFQELKAKQVVQPQLTVCQESGCGNMSDRRDSSEKSGEKLRGVRRTTSGKYGSVIRDPVKKKQVWLGSSDNAEEADNAHLSNRYKFEEQLKARQVVQLQATECPELGCINVIHRKDSGEKLRERLRGVRRRNSGKYISEIQDPIRKKRIWLGTFRTAEEASNAYLSKEREFQEQLKAKQLVQRQPILSQDTVSGDCCNEPEIEASRESPSSVPETEALVSSSSSKHRCSESKTCNANAVEIVKVDNNEGCILGLLKSVPSCQGANLESELFFPILDNNGFLLGEFSKLDDLSICRSEDDYVPTKF